jgi:hypothetical protein
VNVIQALPVRLALVSMLLAAAPAAVAQEPDKARCAAAAAQVARFESQETPYEKRIKAVKAKHGIRKLRDERSQALATLMQAAGPQLQQAAIQRQKAGQAAFSEDFMAGIQKEQQSILAQMQAGTITQEAGKARMDILTQRIRQATASVQTASQLSAPEQEYNAKVAAVEAKYKPLIKAAEDQADRENAADEAALTKLRAEFRPHFEEQSRCSGGGV